MGTTGAVLYIKPRAFITDAPGRHTGAVLDVAIRMLSGVYSAIGIVPSTNQRSLKTWLPHRTVPVVGSDGTMNDEWYRFFNYVANTKLGGASSATLPDIAATVTEAQVNATTAATTVAGVTQQVANNAEALSAVREVAVNNSLSGATQIPSVQRYPTMEP